MSLGGDFCVVCSCEIHQNVRKFAKYLEHKWIQLVGTKLHKLLDYTWVPSYQKQSDTHARTTYLQWVCLTIWHFKHTFTPKHCKILSLLEHFLCLQLSHFFPTPPKRAKNPTHSTHSTPLGPQKSARKPARQFHLHWVDLLFPKLTGKTISSLRM